MQVTYDGYQLTPASGETKLHTERQESSQTKCRTWPGKREHHKDKHILLLSKLEDLDQEADKSRMDDRWKVETRGRTTVKRTPQPSHMILRLRH